jgi:uncharacterized protein with ATP-grasp and redox domains
MKTSMECIPCFFRQALKASELAGADRSRQEIIFSEFAKLFSQFSLDATPPELTRHMYRLIREMSRNDDPFGEIKQRSNERAMAHYDSLRERVASGTGLETAVELAIAGNVIDYGITDIVDIDGALEELLDPGSGEGAGHPGAPRRSIYHYQRFERAFERAGTILFLADNAGETVFDRVLIETMLDRRPGIRITYAVKEKPIINDALLEDARACGLDRVVNVISSGSDLPGTVLGGAREEFVDEFRRADMVVSKGQGNFETLSEEDGPIFFLFMAKCRVVAEYLGCSLGDMLLIDSSTVRRERDRIPGGAGDSRG